MKIFNEAGRLTEEGKKATESFVVMANDLIGTGNTPEEKRLIGSILSSIIGDIVTDQVTKK